MSIKYIILIILIIFFIQPTGGTWFYLYQIRWLYVLILSFLLAYVFTPVVGKIAEKYKFLDYPNERKMHKNPIPRIGGIAIFAAILIAGVRNLHFPLPIIGIFIGLTIIFLIGFFDDIKGLSAKTKLLGQILAALVLIKFGVTISFIPEIPFERTIEVLITIIWVIGITNAINFLDGMDGLCSGLGIISAMCFFVIAWPTRQSDLGYFTIALVGSLLGFLPYNLKPAKIFLGDSGSTLIGFSLASIAILGTWAHKDTVKALSIPILILGIPIFDMIYTTISRIKNGTVKTIKGWLEYVGKDHFHHRLHKMGFNVTGAIAMIFGLNLCLGLGAIVLRETSKQGAMLLFIQAFIIFLIITALMLHGREIE
ncbi:MAG: MraY family glycosyltransferase [Candidatus Firestonebacteria bacterium]